MRKPKRGSVEWLDMSRVTGNEAFDGVEVGIKHIGGKKARRWNLKLMGFNMSEAKRLSEERKGHSKDSCPELWASGVMSGPGVEEVMELVDDVLKSCVSGFKGVEGLNGNAADTQEFCDCLSMVDSMPLFHAALAQQSLAPKQVFAEGSSRRG